MAPAHGIQQALARANQNAGRNTYLWRDEAWTRAEAAAQSGSGGALAGWLISVKDCFEVAGAPTTAGTTYYRDRQGIAREDSWLIARLRSLGAILTGKTHLQELAYGITGENAQFGDCLQPGDPTALTGGSSSGAAASLLEGSAQAAIGTDTGGSLRVPAALCGLAAYRASLGRGDWRGAWQLAPSFDTMGWLFRHLPDGPRLGSLFGSTATTGLPSPRRFAVVADDFLADCHPAILSNLRHCQAELQSLGLTGQSVPVEWWQESRDIFAAIQAAEAAHLHRGHFAAVSGSIRQRLEAGAAMPEAELLAWRAKHTAFRHRMDDLLHHHEFLLLPAAPLHKLEAGADHTANRPRILRYTTPVSLAGMPAITIPFLLHGQPMGGIQLVAARQDDARLLALAAELGRRRE